MAALHHVSLFFFCLFITICAFFFYVFCGSLVLCDFTSVFVFLWPFVF